MKNVVIYGLIAVVVIGIIVLLFFPQLAQLAPFGTTAQQPGTAVVKSSEEQRAAELACRQITPFATAYRVHAVVESKFDQQIIYRSELEFRMQLQQAPEDRIYGAATDIAISEATIGGDAGKSSPLEDVLFLTGAETGERAVFTEFNDLGLMKQHPMAILSQLLKNLSVGDEGRVYRFTYDQLQREYRYRASRDDTTQMRRDLLASFATPAAKLQPLWAAALDEQCLPTSLRAEEVQPIASGGQAGSVRFVMQAERIEDYLDLSSLHFTPQANQTKRWEVAAVNAADFSLKVTSEQEMWDVFLNFQQSKNAARLTRAAEYMIEHLQPEELAQALMEGDLADNEARDAIFALGLTSHPKAEDYMLDTLVNLPINDGNGADLLKIRLMVAVSGNGLVTDKAYNTLSSLANDVEESSNVRKNALINMGSTVSQMQAQGRDISALSNRLNDEIVSHMQDDDSSPAIFSAGNAGLDHLSDEVTDSVVAKLQSSNQKERYASARVLSSDSRHYDMLIDHLTRETSILVGAAIVSGLQKDQLSGEQRSQLQEIRKTAPEQVRYEIEKLLSS